ncbi:MAG TPA: oligopeptidase A [Gammaproteobacteria bacterium]|nr:oligopeptidase A [Gammaproteobacteria bacterium]
MDNPLLQAKGLPLFSRIRAEHIAPAMGQVLEENRNALRVVLKKAGVNPSWESLVEPLEEMEDRLSRVWSPVRHLHSVRDSEELRKVYEQALAWLTEYSTELAQNEDLYHAIKKLYEGPKGEKLDQAQRKLLKDMLLQFRLGGVGLPAEKKARYAQIQQELSQLATRFEQNLLDATQAWSKHVTSLEKLSGLPESSLNMLQQAAQEEDKDGWLLTLQMPSYIAVITYADDRELRREIYEAYSTRASCQGPFGMKWDNTGIIEQILRLRHEQANLLGFSSYAERSLATKMAETPREVMNFLNDLATWARPGAEREFHELQEFAAISLDGDRLQAWDIAYYSEKLREQRFNLSQQTLKPWFPADRVINGMFEIVKRLYGIDIVEVKGADVWHPDVSFYEIRDAAGQVRGQFYLDPYARRNKRGGAWMDECTNRFRRKRELQIPVAYLVCNLSPPGKDRSALLTHEEVITLFHEFGHGLHHMLTLVDYPSVAGINGVEWDAVELPSQFMENWCWEKPALDLISGHYETGEPLPAEWTERLRQSRNFQAAMQLMRQLEFSLFDFRLHMEYDPQHGINPQALIEEVREQVAVVKPPPYNRFQNGFSHIFAGGYAAGYYSYKWAEVLSADAFSRFEENGIFDRQTGRDFMQNILERGGSEKAMDLFIRFRGRKPQIESLLRHNGIAA